MSVESLKAFFDWFAVLLVLLTFVAGSGALITGNVINRRQVEKLRTFERDLTEAKTVLSQQQERAANAEAKVISLQMDLLKMGAREYLLTGETREKLVSTLAPFAGQKVEVRYGLSTMGFLQHVPDPAGPDVSGLCESLIGVFQKANWDIPPAAFVSSLQGPPGMTIQISSEAPPLTVKAANSLLEALRTVPLTVQGPFPTKISAMPRLGTVNVFLPKVPGGPAMLTPMPDPTDETIVLSVLAHPK